MRTYPLKRQYNLATNRANSSSRHVAYLATLCFGEPHYAHTLQVAISQIITPFGRYWTIASTIQSSFPDSQCLEKQDLDRHRLSISSCSSFPTSKELSSNPLQYSRANRPFVVPSLLEEPSLVILPPSMTSELILAKETDLSFWHALDDIIFSEHAFYSPRILSLPLQTTIIRRHLASGARRFMPDVIDQLRNTLDREWGPGKTKQWRSVNLFDSLLNVVNNMVSVIFVGNNLGKMGFQSDS